MKKTYVTPEIEKIAFQYRDQVVVASNGKCREVNSHEVDAGVGGCENWQTSMNNEA